MCGGGAHAVVHSVSVGRARVIEHTIHAYKYAHRIMKSVRAGGGGAFVVRPYRYILSYMCTMCVCCTRPKREKPKRAVTRARTYRQQTVSFGYALTKIKKKKKKTVIIINDVGGGEVTIRQTLGNLREQVPVAAARLTTRGIAFCVATKRIGFVGILSCRNVLIFFFLTLTVSK